MKELTMNEMEQVNGGIAPLIAIPAGYLLRKYGKTLVIGAVGIVAGWFSD